MISGDLFDANGVILIAVDDEFTLDRRDIDKLNPKSVHAQFLSKYCAKGSEHKEKIQNIIASRGEATEISVEIDDKVFVLFAYSSQGNPEDYPEGKLPARGFELLIEPLRKALLYCKKKFPDKTVHSVPIGTGIRNEYRKKLDMTLEYAEKIITETAYEIGVEVKIINKPN